MHIKKIFKILSGIILFFTLPSLLFFGFLYFKYNKDLPEGIEGKQADALAYKMLESLNYKAYKKTDTIEWTFSKRHHYKWYKRAGVCEVYWKKYKVVLHLKNTNQSEVYVANLLQNKKNKNTKKLIKKAQDYFNNDSFWLVAPYKVFDTGVIRKLVRTKDQKEALLVTYTSGGSTPGDSYLWLLKDTYKPTAFKMWTSIIPIGGLEASWEDWTTTQSKAQLPTFHKLFFLGFPLEDIVGLN